MSRCWVPSESTTKQPGSDEIEIRTQTWHDQDLVFFRFLEPKNGPVFGPRKRYQNVARAICWYTKRGLISGPEIGTTFAQPEQVQKSSSNSPGDRRLAVLKSMGTGGSSGRKRVFRVNMNETNIRRADDVKSGLIVRKRKTRLLVWIQKLTSSRRNISQITFMCNDPSVQPWLPQIILGNEHVLRKHDLNAVDTALPSSV